MNIYSLLAIIGATTYLVVAIFIYFKTKENAVNRSFAILLLCVSLWNAEVAGILSAHTSQFADIWAKIFRNGLLFIPPTVLHFTLLFTSPKGVPERTPKILWVAYLTSCFFAVINWTPFFTRGVRMTPYGYHAVAGPVYFLFILQFIICILLSLYYLIRGFISADRYQRHRLKYFFLAIAVSFVLGSLNFTAMFRIQESYIGSIAVTVGLLIASYSVVQHRLMDVSVFMAKGLSYVLSIITIGVPTFLFILFLENYFFHQTEISFAALLVAFGIGSIIWFNSLKVVFDRAMRHIIIKDKYDYHRILEDFSRRLVTIIDLNRLLQMLAETIHKSMGVTNTSIFLYDSEKELFRVRFPRVLSREAIKISEAEIEYMKERREAILRFELERGRRKKEENEILKIMLNFKADVCLPLIYTNRLIGFINLGPKPEGELYYQEDLALLYPLANQMAIAIENANLYENLKRSQGIMRRADRLASLGTLIASLAHEIRNPLVSIKTFTQLLPERIDDEEFRSYFLKVASGEIDRLTGLINELLGFARPSEPKPQGEDINALIDKMEVLISSEARKKNITIAKQYGKDLPQIKVDAEQIKQVLLNIFLNAIQAIHGEGKIYTETRMVQVPIQETPETFMQIEIRDTGVGIPEENLEKIFDPFFSTRPEGSGLGLAISNQIIHEHGGFINVESEVGKGTSFKVHLPLNSGGKIGP